LYSNRRIKNIITVKNTIKAVTSDQVTKAFKSKYNFPTIIDRYETVEDKERKNNEMLEVERKRKQIDFEVQDGDHTKANTYTRFKITNTPTDENGHHMYGFEQIMNKLTVGGSEYDWKVRTWIYGEENANFVDEEITRKRIGHYATIETILFTNIPKVNNIINQVYQENETLTCVYDALILFSFTLCQKSWFPLNVRKESSFIFVSKSCTQSCGGRKRRYIRSSMIIVLSSKINVAQTFNFSRYFAKSSA
jgi:hypothetical protein